ncbi:MAG: DNA-binding protein [Rhodocyclales bacterium GT-UBC]|nr:MAG: DNA-binding protein [Rhodocyclales bacterium GT-UBC]
MVLALVALAWHGYGKYQQMTIKTEQAAAELPMADLPAERPLSRPERPTGLEYRCDGRIYCAQMTSCAEANWFLKNCPGTKMDGNNDGIPCEKQWCK